MLSSGCSETPRRVPGEKVVLGYTVREEERDNAECDRDS